MITAKTPERARVGLFRDSHRGRFTRFPIAAALSASAGIFAMSALVDLLDDADVTLPFAAAAVATGIPGWLELRALQPPRARTAPALFTMVTLAWSTLILAAAAAHLLADATDSVDTALFEGAATSTTTAMTTVDPSLEPAGLLAFRALTQWTAGLGALLVALVVIPLILRGQEVSGRGQSRHARTALLTGRTRGTRKVVAIYGGFTMALAVAYLGAGMGIGNAVGYAMATASTGGLGTQPGSLAGFDGGVQWVATVGMGIAGLHLGVVWWVLRGDRKSLRRDTELKLYVSVLVIATVAATFWLADAEGNGLRIAAVQVSSAMSTTGFTSTAWPALDNSVQTLLVALIGIGAMAGSAGGGFRYIRMIEAFGFARRELTRQLHPTVVSVVRLNGLGVSERSLERMNGYMVVFVLTGAIGAGAVALGDSSVDPTSAITMAISALSTGGPYLGETSVAELSWFSKLALATVMLLGRLSIYAVLIAVANTLRRVVQFSGISLKSGNDG